MKPATRSALPVLLLAAALAAGCAARGGPDAGRRVVRVLVPASERPFWRPLAARFEAAHAGVRVDLVEGPESTDLREDLYTASLLARDPTFDLIYMDVIWTAKFAAAGWLRPLDHVLPPAELAALLPPAVEAGRYRGTLHRLPVRTDVGVLYSRLDLLEAAGRAPPRTFEDLFAAARALQSPPGRWGFVWQGKQYEGLVCNFLEVLRGHGGFWVDPATLEVGLDRPEAARALDFVIRCVGEDGISPRGVTTYEEEEGRRLFQDGRAVFLRNWPYAWALVQGEGSAVAGRVGISAMVAEPGRRPGVTLGGWGLGVSAYSREPELAAAFAASVTTLEAQRLLCGPTGFAPARLEAYRDSALLAANPFLPRLAELHEHAVARPAIARYAAASDILQRHLSAALSGGEAPAPALAAAAAETRAILGAPGGGR